MTRYSGLSLDTITLMAAISASQHGNRTVRRIETSQEKPILSERDAWNAAVEQKKAKRRAKESKQ